MTTAACALAWRLQTVFAWLSPALLPLFIAALFLYLPSWLINRQNGDFVEYGLVADPIAKGLRYFVFMSLAVFPPFTMCFMGYYQFVCGYFRHHKPYRPYRALCRHFARSLRFASISTEKMIRLAVTQVVVVGLPEEYFFRGYVQTRLRRVWPQKRRGVRGFFDLAIVFTSILFALGHVLVDLNPMRLAVFFPSLLFGWLRDRTGSITASVLFHASCNIVSELLHRMAFR